MSLANCGFIQLVFVLAAIVRCYLDSENARLLNRLDYTLQQSSPVYFAAGVCR